MTTMLRVSERTRDRVMQVAAVDFGGATAEETLNRLLDEHWEAQAVAAMDLDIPELEIPEPEIEYEAPEPIFSTEYSWTEATKKLKDRRALIPDEDPGDDAGDNS